MKATYDCSGGHTSCSYMGLCWEDIKNIEWVSIEHIATSMESASNRTLFYGKDLNHVRGWYFWLRRQLGVKKAIDAIKKIGEIMRRGLQITSYTKSLVLGKLKGLRNREKKEGRGRGRKFNRNSPDFRISSLQNT